MDVQNLLGHLVRKLFADFFSILNTDTVYRALLLLVLILSVIDGGYYSSLSTIVWIVRHLIAPVIRYLHPVVHYIAVTGGQLDTKAFVSFFVTYNWFLIIQSLWHAWCMSVCSWTFSICLGQESRLISILWNNQHHKWKLEPLIFLQLYENVWYLYKAFHVWDHILNTIY